MINTINSMLEFTLEGSGANPTEIDCNAMLESIKSDLALMINESGANICIDHLPEIRGFETELRLLFQNLLTNAIKFRKKQVKPEIQISAQRQNGYWKLYVQDNGIGISNENIERIFMPFQRLNSYDEYEGFGIGLAHCKKIAELHNGSIEVDSSMDTGSTFIVTIPVE
jgi:light-regulated signal transduction histidine kinase (bacteriophytochrome)